MTAIFISHRSSDDAEAEALKDWLGQQGHERLFLDFDPADGIPAGVDWEQRLYQELRRCQALLIVLTPAWLDSKWCGNELAIAREKGKAVFVVRVKPCPGGPVIPAIQEVDLTPTGLKKLARGLKEHGLDPRDAFDWKPDRPIYPGLAAFDVDDAAIFFGRSEESWQVVESLRRMRLQARGSPKLLLITGASGSGKSSLMRAGVLARLRKEPASWIAARPFRRGTDAISALAEALAWAFPTDRRPASLAAITTRLAGPDGAGQLLTIARELRLALDRPEATLVLALDQAEELLAAERGDDAAKLLDLFRATLAVVANDILVIATIRSDRLGAWQQHGSIKATADHGELPFEMLPLGPMPMARIGEIVRGPAAYEGLRIDDDLVDAVRADTVTPDALPLLAYTLQYLHRQFAKDGRLTLAEYQSFGGLEGSVRSQADAAIPIEKLSEEDRRALQEAFVPGLVRATAQGGFSRRRALLATLPPRAEPHLRSLIDEARLLTTDTDPQGGVTVEVAHESLLRVWPTLARWIAEDAERLRRLEAVQRAAHDWAQAGRGEDFLVHRDHRLSDAEMLIAEPRFAARLDYSDRDYLTACRNAQNEREAAEKEVQERELRAAQALAEEQKAKTRRTRIGLAVASVLAVVAAGLGWWALDRAGAAEEQLSRANNALATGLWNDLDFTNDDLLTPAERMALWMLAEDAGPVRAPFVAELFASAERMQRFARRPGAVSRALGLGWPSPADAEAAFRRGTLSIADTTDADQLLDLAQAAQLLAENLTSEQAQPEMTSTLEALADSRNPWKLRTLAQVVQALPVRLTAEQTEDALTPILREMDRVIGPSRIPVEPGEVEALAQAVRALAGNLNAERARDTLIRVLTLLAASTSPRELQALAEAVQALPVSLTTEQARDALAPILTAIIADTTNAAELAALAKAAQALSVPLEATQAREMMAIVFKASGGTDFYQARALTPAVQVLAAKLIAEQAHDALDTVLDTLKGTDDYGQATVLAATAQALALKLTGEQRQEALDAVLEALKSTTEFSRFQVLTWAAQALARTLSVDQVRDAVGPILTALASRPQLEGTFDAWNLRTLSQALAVPLTTEQVGYTLMAIARTTESDQLRTSVPAAQALLERRTGEQARDALGPVLDAIGAGAYGSLTHEELWVLAQTIQVVAVQLSDKQARDALAAVLATLWQMAVHSESTALALAETVQALPVELTDDQASEAFGRLLEAIQYETFPDTLETFAQAVRALVAKLTAEQANAAISSLLDEMGATTDTGQSQVLVSTTQALAARLTAEGAQEARKGVRRGLAGASSSVEAAGWAEALVALLPREKPEIGVDEIVEALKYPTTAGPATDVLLDGLHGIDPNAPGKEAGLVANLAWLTTAYPSIELDKPPACPEPLPNQQDLACPDGGTRPEPALVQGEG